MPESEAQRLPPSETYLRELEEQLLGEFGERNARIERLRRLRYMETPVDIPPAYRSSAREVRTPVAREQLKRVIGSLTANRPLVHVPPAEPTAAARTSADLRARWTNAALRRMDSEAARDVFGMLIDAMVADGAGVLKLLYAPDRWAGYPRRAGEPDESAATFLQRAERFKKSARFPLAWRDVDVTTFYPLEGEEGLEACLEIAERPRHLVQRRYGLISDRRSGRLVPADGAPRAADRSAGPPAAPNAAPRVTARVVEYWDDEYFAYLVDGHLVRRGRHGYGAIPYVQAYGDQTPSRDPAKAGVSMLASMEYLVPLLDQLLTMKQNALFLYAYPTPKITNFSPVDPSLGNDGRPRSLDFRPGELLPLYQGEDLSFLQWEGTPPDLDELIAQTRAMIDQAGAPSVLFGVPPDGNASGYLLNQLINTARVSFQQIARHAEQALERIVRLMWRLVESRIGETVFVFEAEDEQGWIGLGPEDIDGYRAVRVRMDPLGPADDVAQGTLAASLVSARLASRRWAMREKLGIEDAEAVEDEMLLDELIDAPEVRAAIVREALGQAGFASPPAKEPADVGA
ncbi:MAG: hypothetical protein OXG65_10710 [Chloroflexi bacterium]|nr:hypothetical protein [Chloroflexota bacterium]